VTEKNQFYAFFLLATHLWSFIDQNNVNCDKSDHYIDFSCFGDVCSIIQWSEQLQEARREDVRVVLLVR